MIELTKKQSKVLMELWLHPSRRFSDMMHVTGLTSDDFKFYVRKFIKAGLIEKDQTGEYRLTVMGKEIANRYDYDEQQILHMPKLTTAVFVHRHHEGRSEYLFMKRKRQPFYGFWGVIGRPVRVGETFEQAAANGLEQQTGLNLPLELKGFCRQMDVGADKSPLEDKLFVAYRAEWGGEELIEWPYAVSAWMTLDEYESIGKRFKSAVQMLRNIDQDQLWFTEDKTRYTGDDF